MIRSLMISQFIKWQTNGCFLSTLYHIFIHSRMKCFFYGEKSPAKSLHGFFFLQINSFAFICWKLNYKIVLYQIPRWIYSIYIPATSREHHFHCENVAFSHFQLKIHHQWICNIHSIRPISNQNVSLRWNWKIIFNIFGNKYTLREETYGRPELVTLESSISASFFLFVRQFNVVCVVEYYAVLAAKRFCAKWVVCYSNVNGYLEWVSCNKQWSRYLSVVIEFNKL